MQVLLLRFEAPLMSFGAPIIDQHGVIQPYPALSMVCGLLGNALGLHHRDADRLQRLQERLRCAARQDRPGTRLRDYQTVDLNQDFMRDDRAWTTRGALQQRTGGSASKWRKGQGPPHIRYRDYWADAVYTVALALEPPAEQPSVDDLDRALRSPERPLFIGRKCCLPAGPVLLGRTQAPTLTHALAAAPPLGELPPGASLPAWWPTHPEAAEPDALQLPVTDARDWTNQIHVGERWIAAGHIKLIPEEPAHD